MHKNLELQKIARFKLIKTLFFYLLLLISSDLPSIVSSLFFNSLYLTFLSPEKKKNFLLIQLNALKKRCLHVIHWKNKLNCYHFLQATYFDIFIYLKNHILFSVVNKENSICNDKCLPWCSSRSMSNCWISPFSVSIFSRSSAVLNKRQKRFKTSLYGRFFCLDTTTNLLMLAFTTILQASVLPTL